MISSGKILSVPLGRCRKGSRLTGFLMTDTRSAAGIFGPLSRIHFTIYSLGLTRRSARDADFDSRKSIFN